MSVTTVRDLVAAVDRIAPLAKAAEWDRVGLQIGDPDAVAGPVAVVHEVTDAVVSAAVARGIGTLVAYHPLLFTPQRRFVAGSGPGGRSYALARAGIAVVVVHTAFDVAEGGTANALADALGLEAIRPFGPAWPPEQVKVVTYVPSASVDLVVTAMANAGAGVIGRYTGCSFQTPGIGTFRPGPGAAPTVGTVGEQAAVDETRIEMVAPASAADDVVTALAAAHPYEEPAFDVFPVASGAGFVGRCGSLPTPWSLSDLSRFAGSVLATRCRIAGAPDRSVRTVAVVPGSGRSFLPAASAVADVLVTGDVSHHAAREALDRGLAVIDAGHVPTERPGLASLYASVSEIVDVVDLGAPDPHPWEEP